MCINILFLVTLRTKIVFIVSLDLTILEWIDQRNNSNVRRVNAHILPSQFEGVMVII